MARVAHGGRAAHRPRDVFVRPSNRESLGLQSNAVEKRTIRQPARPLAGCFTVVLKVGEFHAGMDTRKSRTIGIEDFAENYIQPAPDAEGW